MRIGRLRDIARTSNPRTRFSSVQDNILSGEERFLPHGRSLEPTGVVRLIDNMDRVVRLAVSLTSHQTGFSTGRFTRPRVRTQRSIHIFAGITGTREY